MIILMRQILLLLIKFYQFFISPLLGQNCKFYPTCSNYAKEALEKRHLLSAIYLISKRLLKCNPFSSGGFDPVKHSEIKHD